MPTKRFNSAHALRITFLSGIILLVVIGGVLAGIYGKGSPRRAERESEFSRLLREYDFKCGQILETGSPVVLRQEFERLEGDLDRLEKQAGWVESWLSVLKRRRQLAGYAEELGTDSHYAESYRQSAGRAAAAFPYSEPIAAVAASALVRDAAITREGEAELRQFLPLLASPHLFPMRLGLHVLLGDFGTAEKAAASVLADVYRSPDFAVSGFHQPGIPLAERQAAAIVADLLILKILAQDISMPGVPGTAMDIQAAVYAFPSPAIIRLAAEYFYDFGDLLRSAELFSMLPDETDLSRQADALWLAGYNDNARTLWSLVMAGHTEEALHSNDLYGRALYNLALTAPTQAENYALLRHLTGQDNAWQPVSQGLIRQYGLIRLSRLFEAPQGLSLLDAERGAPGPADTLIDLEILKRRTEIGEMARVIAETWLLLDRYPTADEVYQWGLWYFNLQRSYAESAMLLKAAARHNFSGWWVDLYEAIRLIREGDPDSAEKILAAIPADAHQASDGYWTAAANLGRILEARNAPAQALENYERAMAALPGYGESLDGTGQPAAWHNDASRIQVRIAHCLRSLGRNAESRRALEYAIGLNEDNLNARLELSRLE